MGNTIDTSAPQWGIFSSDRPLLEGAIAYIGNSGAITHNSEGGWLASPHKVSTLGSEENLEKLKDLMKEHEHSIETAWRVDYPSVSIQDGLAKAWVLDLGAIKVIRRKYYSSIHVSWVLFDKPIDPQAMEECEEKKLLERALKACKEISDLALQWEKWDEVPYSSHHCYHRFMSSRLSWETLELATRQIIDTKDVELHLKVMDVLERQYGRLLNN